MAAFILAFNAALSMRIVQYLLVVLVVSFFITASWLGVRNYFLKVSLKTTKADLVWVQGALNLQNSYVKQLNKDVKALEDQQRAKGAEAEQAKATAARRAQEIMRLKMSKDCTEVTQWGIEQGLSQSHW